MKSLVMRAQKGDLSAFEQLVLAYQSRIYSLALNLTSNADDAQDLSQEVFIRAYSALGTFRLEADFGTWLHRIAVNTWINMQRKHKKVTYISLDEPVHNGESDMSREVAAATERPDELYEEKEFREQVRTVLKELTDEHRTVLVLREVYGYSYDEVAQMLNCTLGTVKSRLNRAKQAFKDKLTSMSEQLGNIPAKGRQVSKYEQSP
ncbi:sigma-70 family RNA polymerase sigma factor [Heliobacterium mobile]